MSRSSREDAGAAADERVREILAEHGDGGGIPRPTTFYLYGGDLDALRRASEAMGFETWPAAAAPGTTPGLILGKTMAVDDATSDRLLAEMDALAAEVGASFDGWETQMVLN